jgi:DNA-binding protein Fis
VRKLNNKKFTLQFDAKMELKDVLSKIETFRSQLDTLEIPEGATKKFEKAFDKVLNSLEGFDVIAGKGIESLADTKDLEKAWKKVLSDLNNLEVVFRSLDASNIFPKTVIDNIKKAESALEAYNKKLTGAKESDAYKSKFKEREQALNKETILTKQLEDARNKQIKAEG